MIYLLLGVMWAFAYQMVALNVPGLPLAGRLDRRRAGRPPARADLLQYCHSHYYRIRRYHCGSPDDRTLVMLEALVGQLYPAIVLAWLVSLAIMHQKEKPRNFQDQKRR